MRPKILLFLRKTLGDFYISSKDKNDLFFILLLLVGVYDLVLKFFARSWI